MAQNQEIVLITGANTGLGLELARSLLRDYKDRFYVFIGTRTPSKGDAAVKELHDQGLQNCETIEINVTDDKSIAQAASIVQQKFGRLDVLHLNAGIAPDKDMIPAKQPISKIIMANMETNVAGAASTFEHFLPLLQKADNPRVIFTSSGAGSLRGVHTHGGIVQPYPGYSMSKSAVNMVMLWCYKRYGKDMRINSTCPGFRATNLNHFGKTVDHAPGQLEKGVVNAVRLSLLGKDGESGTITQTDDATGEVQTVPW